MNSPVGGMSGPVAGMNGPVAGIRASEARVSHVSAARGHSSAGPPALKSLATREDPALQRMAAGLPFPVPRADAESFTEIDPG